MRRTLIVTTAALTLVAGAAHAQPSSAPPPDDRTAPAPDVGGAEAAGAGSEVVVVADRRAEPLDKVGQSVTVLTLPQIRADQELAVSDILARTPGVSFSRNGGPGEATSLYIRGAETDQTAVLIDGVKLNDPSAPGGGFNFADLLVGDISRIEVLRGPQSTLYGSQAIGGVVNIVTADPQGPFGGDLQLEGGSYGTGYGKASLGGRQGPWTYRLAANAYTTDGISAFDRRLGGRETDGYRNSGVSGRLGYDFSPDASLDLRALFVQAHNDFDGFSTPTFSFGDDSETGSTRETLLYSGLNFAVLDGRLKNRVAGQFTLTQRDNDDPADAPVTRTFDGRGTNARAEYQGSFLIAPGYTATFGAEHEREAIATSSPAFGPGGTKADLHIDSGYGQLQAEVIPGLNLTGGVRYDDHSAFGGHTTGQAAAAWSILGGGTVLRFSYGSGFKAPTLYQLYSEYGNAALQPESAEGYDGGIEQRFWGGRGSVQVTGFDRDTTDLITFVSCYGAPAVGLCATRGAFGGYYANVARAHADGVELTGALRPLDGLELTANYTFTDSRDRSPGAASFDRLLARRPQDTANASAAYRWPFALTTTVAVRYAGRSFDDALNTVRLKSYTLVDLRASYPLRPGLEIYGRVENLFDRAYETAYQYGSLGRAGYAGVRATF